jgi:hypothetical protein
MKRTVARKAALFLAPTFLVALTLASCWHCTTRSTHPAARRPPGAAPGSSDVEIRPGTGEFVYHDDGDNTDRPVRVFYYRPPGFPAGKSKVVFTMHGSERNAKAALARMLPYAGRYDALLLAPEFSKTFYPDADDYNRGFVKAGGGTGRLRKRSDWTFLTIEEIFDLVRKHIPGAPGTYSIQGNSGAGQFISRLALLVPEARFDVAAGSNGGWYTLPTRDEPYPHGIKDLELSDAGIEHAYGKKVVTVVGADDTDPNSYELTHDTFSDAQGENRRERALFYHGHMRADAAARRVPFNWDILVVEGVGHSATLMAHATAGAVFAGLSRAADVVLAPVDDTYVDESKPGEVFGALSELRVGGEPTSTAFLKFDLASVEEPVAVALLKLFVTNGSSGQQLVHEVAETSWTESELAWRGAPVLGARAGMTSRGEKDSIVYVDVTDYVNKRAGGKASVALASGDRDELRFASSEATKFPVQLVLLRRR